MFSRLAAVDCRGLWLPSERGLYRVVLGLKRCLNIVCSNDRLVQDIRIEETGVAGQMITWWDVQSRVGCRQKLPVLLLLLLITFVSETNHVSSVYNVAPILYLHSGLHVMLLTMLNVLYFYISTFRSVRCPLWLFFAHVLSEWFWDGSTCLCYYWYNFCFYTPHALKVCSIIIIIIIIIIAIIVVVCSEIHTKHINTPCWHNLEFCKLKDGVHTVTTRPLRVKEHALYPYTVGRNAPSTDHLVLFARNICVAWQEMYFFFSRNPKVHHSIHKISHWFIYLSFKFSLHKCIYVPSSSACYMSVPSLFSICRSGARCRVQAVQPVTLYSRRHGSHVVSRSVMPRFASIFRVRVTTGTLIAVTTKLFLCPSWRHKGGIEV